MSSGLFCFGHLSDVNTYVVGGPESFEFEVPVQAFTEAALKLQRQLGHAFVLRIVHERTHRFQVLNTRDVRRGRGSTIRRKRGRRSRRL